MRKVIGALALAVALAGFSLVASPGVQADFPVYDVDDPVSVEYYESRYDWDDSLPGGEADVVGWLKEWTCAEGGKIRAPCGSISIRALAAYRAEFGQGVRLCGPPTDLIELHFAPNCYIDGRDVVKIGRNAAQIRALQRSYVGRWYCSRTDAAAVPMQAALGCLTD